jgi:hypothetical protein
MNIYSSINHVNELRIVILQFSFLLKKLLYIYSYNYVLLRFQFNKILKNRKIKMFKPLDIFKTKISCNQIINNFNT